MFVDGKGGHLTDEGFIAVLRDGEKDKKERESAKEGRKKLHAIKRSRKKKIEKEWQKLVKKWSTDHTTWVETTAQLTMDGVPKKRHPRPPKKPTKAEVEANLISKAKLDLVMLLSPSSAETMQMGTDKAFGSDSDSSPDLEMDSDSL